MAKKTENNLPQTIDNQLVEWRKKFAKEIPERVGLAFYTNEKGETEVEVYFADDNMWLSQATMSELFDVEEHTITYHIKEIYKSGELEEFPTTRKIRAVRTEGNRQVNREIQFYNLDLVISVGYRVNSYKATQFRKFATRILHEYIQKGFVINDNRFKNGNKFDESYFREMLERIREIRLSERRIYLKITDIFALSSDYDKNSEIARHFFAFIQNQLHFAIAGGTAAEIIFDRADKTKENMGLTTWKYAPDGKILRTDVTVAKNYLAENELKRLALVVSAFLDMAELRAEQHLPTTMQQWIEFMNGYLKLNNLPVLKGSGAKSKEQADEKALAEYTEFRVIQDKDYIGDFEKMMQQIAKTKE
ncbi:MAG: virulence RhuM family protein [Paludibacter sp.]|nr:virulence RhuM family protein [Paludibacter sp.]